MLGILYITGNMVFTIDSNLYLQLFISELCFIFIYTLIDYLRILKIEKIGYADLLLVGVGLSIFLPIFVNKEQQIFSYSLLFLTVLFDLFLFNKFAKLNFYKRSSFSTLGASLLEVFLFQSYVLKITGIKLIANVIYTMSIRALIILAIMNIISFTIKKYKINT